MSKQDLLILTSPPASGKTYWIDSFRNEIQEKRILVVSPLRALADECRSKWGDSIMVVTPEEWLSKELYTDILIFDEFHLFFYWGDSFRPLMWEMFYEVSLRAKLTVLLTATLSEAMKENIALFKTQFDSITLVDCGNQKLRTPPKTYIKAPDKLWMRELIYTEPKGATVKLIFCQYRGEVFQWEKDLTEKGYTCVTCVGGESKYMAQKLKITPTPDFIISTTVLSHGVNLPQIKKIFFTYQIQNIDFWIQMVARGGRRGEDYDVFALEVPFQGVRFRPLWNFFKVKWLGLKISVFQYLNSDCFLLTKTSE